MQIEPINIVNEENYRRKTEVFWGLHARGEVLKKSSIIPEILCSSKLWVYAAYISEQHF